MGVREFVGVSSWGQIRFTVFWGGTNPIAILDEEALLATCAYIDLNPVAAGLAATPEKSKHTSVRQRLQHARDEGKLADLKEAAHNGVAGMHSTRRIAADEGACIKTDYTAVEGVVGSICRHAISRLQVPHRVRADPKTSGRLAALAAYPTLVGLGMGC